MTSLGQFSCRPFISDISCNRLVMNSLDKHDLAIRLITTMANVNNALPPQLQLPNKGAV